jgi:phosphomannomutase
MTLDISPHIFRAYDIRGLYGKDIDPEILYKIGLATGTYVKKNRKGQSLVVGNDIRQSSIPLVHAFLSGVSATGVSSTYVGTTAFGQTLFKGGELKKDLIAFVTASHLPPEWNGIKFYYGDGVGLPEEELQIIRDYVLNGENTLANWQHVGKVTTADPVEGYKNYFRSHFHFEKPLTVALDCGGGSMTLSAPDVFQSLHLTVKPVYCETDPSFSKRPSDPKPQHLTTLIDTVQQYSCDFGVAFDGDGDRAVIVDNTGTVLSADTTGIILGKYGLKKREGTVIVNVECSKAVQEQLEPLGYTIKHIPVGHTFLTLHAKQEHSPLGIESSGHLILPEYFLFDDALVVPLKIAEILATTGRSLSDIVQEIPSYPRNKLEIACDDDYKFEVIRTLQQMLSKEYPKVNTMDGIRIDLDDGWVLIRASNTSPIIRLTAEADNDTVLQSITDEFNQKTKEFIEKTKHMVTH